MAIQYRALSGLMLLHLGALLGVLYIAVYGISLLEFAFHFGAYLLGGLGITALYHRAWAHKAVTFVRPIEYILVVCATFVLQMPARQWISSHIKHHDHTDDDDDPYNIQRGFWWAHFEWIVLAPLPPIELPDRLADNPVIRWQNDNYWTIFVTLNAILPVGVAILAGAPWWGGLLVSALRVVLTCHIVFAVNSVCHYWGTRPYTTDVSARDVWWFPFALGEQYHNYHHAFPRDYRHGVGRFDFDPTKWLIDGLAKLGLASDRFAIPDKRIKMAKEMVRAERQKTYEPV